VSTTRLLLLPLLMLPLLVHLCSSLQGLNSFAAQDFGVYRSTKYSTLTGGLRRCLLPCCLVCLVCDVHCQLLAAVSGRETASSVMAHKLADQAFVLALSRQASGGCTQSAVGASCLPLKMPKSKVSMQLQLLASVVLPSLMHCVRPSVCMCLTCACLIFRWHLRLHAVTHHMGCDGGAADLNNLTASVTQTFSDNSVLRVEVGGAGVLLWYSTCLLYLCGTAPCVLHQKPLCLLLTPHPSI
jgi:hypothetical protein